MNHRLRLINVLFTFLFFNVLVAQKSYTITAKILDEQDQPIELGNVLLLNPKDSSLLKGDVFMDGEVRIEKISDNFFLLNLTALGYEPFYQKLLPSKVTESS